METKKIEKLMTLQNKKRSQLADFLEIPRSYVTMWFTRQSVPKEYIPNIAIFLETTSDELLSCFVNHNTNEQTS